MPTNSLVICPKCGARRVFIGMRKGSSGGEIRSFHCAPCGARSEYELRGHSVVELNASPSPPSAAAASA